MGYQWVTNTNIIHRVLLIENCYGLINILFLFVFKTIDGKYGSTTNNHKAIDWNNDDKQGPSMYTCVTGT